MKGRLLMVVSQKDTSEKIFSEKFPTVKIPAENRFSRCDLCSKIKESYSKIHQSDDIKRSSLKEYQEWHRKMASSQRHDFHTCIQRAFAYPELEMCITTDGMDQLKTMLPYSRMCYSTILKSHLLKIHVMGSMCFHKSTVCYLDIMKFPHDSNLNTNVILQTILRHKDSLPRKLHIQLDNTCRENKNQFVFHFLAFLVESQIFDELTVGFLMKGHTHSQIDQYFSRLSTYIGSSARGVLTYQQFCTAIKDCFNKNLPRNEIPAMVGLESIDESMSTNVPQQGRMLVDAVRLRKIYAFREWLIPFSKKLKNLHPYHHFWFFLDENGKAVMKYKKWAADAYSSKNSIILNSLPESSPLLVVPSKEKVDFVKLQQTVQKAVQVGALTKEERSEWNCFLAEEEEYFENYAGYEHLKIEDREMHHKRDVNYCVDPDDFGMIKELVARVLHRDDHHAIPEALRQARLNLETTTRDVSPFSKSTFLSCFSSHVSNMVCAEPNSHKVTQKSKSKENKPFKNSFLVINPDVDWCLSQSYSLVDLEDKPWLCRALTEPNKDGFITVQWYTGSVKSTWDVMKVKRQNHKGMINYTTTIHKDSVILSHFRLKNKMIPNEAYEAIASDLKNQCALYKSRVNTLNNTDL